LRGAEVAAEGEMEIDAVLEAVVLKTNEGDAGVLGAALCFEVFEERGAIDAEGDVAEGAFLGEAGLLNFLFEEDLLFGEGEVGGEG
jgi:hypothetical protein